MADRYWIGQSGNWVDTAHWSLTSGGSGGASMPGNGDKAIFDENSFAWTGIDQTITVTGAPVSIQEFESAYASDIFSIVGYLGFEGGGSVDYTAVRNGGDIEFLGGSYTFRPPNSTFNWLGISGGTVQQTAGIYAEAGIIQVRNGIHDFNFNTVMVLGYDLGEYGELYKVSAGSGTMWISEGGSFSADPTATISPYANIVCAGDFYGGGHTFNSVSVSIPAGASYVFEGSNTFNYLGLELREKGGAQATITVEPGSTQTFINDWPFYAGWWNPAPNAADLLVTSSAAWYLDVTGATGNAEFWDCEIVNCNVVGSGAVVNAPTYGGCIDGSGNVGIEFFDGVIGTKNIYVNVEYGITIYEATIVPGADVVIVPHAPTLGGPAADVPTGGIVVTPHAPTIGGTGIVVPTVDVDITPQAPSVLWVAPLIPTQHITVLTFGPHFGNVFITTVAVHINVRHPSVIWALPRSEAPGAVVIYKCILTDPDGLADLVLPMASFQARLRDGEPSYLSCVVPNSSLYAEEILARANGELKIRQGFRLLDGREALQDIITVDNETLSIDRGARSDSATLVGHRTRSSSTPAERTMQAVSYFAMEAAGKRRVRCAIDLFLRPGDTCIYGESGNDWFVTGQISYAVSASPVSAIMEVSEA